MSFYKEVSKLIEVHSFEAANQHLKEGWTLIKPVTNNSSTVTEKGIMQHTAIVYIMAQLKGDGTQKPVTKKTDSTEKPKDKSPTEIPTQEIVRKILSPEYEGEDITFEEDNKVVKVVYSTDKDAWMRVNDKMRSQLGFKYYSKPGRWVYEG